MGEAKRRRKLDPNYGQPNWSKLLIDCNPQEHPSHFTMERWKKLATHFVPKDILEKAVEFSLGVENYAIPSELRKKYPSKYPREIIELEWNPTTQKWIAEFINNLDSTKKLNDSQLKNALGNIRKAIALFVIDSDEDEDEDEMEEEA